MLLALTLLPGPLMWLDALPRPFSPATRRSSWQTQDVLFLRPAVPARPKARLWIVEIMPNALKSRQGGHSAMRSGSSCINLLHRLLVSFSEGKVEAIQQIHLRCFPNFLATGGNFAKLTSNGCQSCRPHPQFYPPLVSKDDLEKEFWTCIPPAN